MFGKNRFDKKKHDELVQAIEELDERCKAQIDKAVSKLEELRQDKIYVLSVEENDQDQVQNIKRQLESAKKMMKWSPPNILILNRKLKELSVEELKGLLDHAKKLRGESNEK